MKNKIIIASLVISINSVWAGFNFGECSGSGTFAQHIEAYGGDKEKAVDVGFIPKGIKGLKIELRSDKDVDIRLYGDKNDNLYGELNDKIVHWPYGILHKGYKETKAYKGVNVTYSGYNGSNGNLGHEYIYIDGATPTAMQMKAFGYKEGDATVNYSWTDKEGCTIATNGSGHFTQEIAKKNIEVVGDIPADIENLEVSLKSDKDIDIQLYGADGTAIIAWPSGILNGSSKQTTTYHGMTIEWSGYKGTNGNKGHEYIKISGKTTEKITMKVFGYQAGMADVDYSWGSNESTGYNHEIIVRTVTNLENSEDISYLINICKTNNINTISIAFKQDEDDEDDSGVVFYPSKIATVAYGYENKDLLKELIEQAHANAIKIKAWIPQFHDQIAFKKHKSWQMQKYVDGKLMPVTGEYFVNPIHKGVQDYELSIIKEITDNYNIDGIMLDWIRFDAYNMDLSEYTQKDYQNEYTYNPLEIDFSSKNNRRDDWTTYRTTQIAKYIARVKKITLEKKITLGIYTLSPEWEEVAQDPSKFYQSIDSISPMAYYNDWNCGEDWIYAPLNDNSSECGKPIIASTKDKVHGKSIIPTFDIDWNDNVYKNIYTNIDKNYPNITTFSWFKKGKWTEENVQRIDNFSKQYTPKNNYYVSIENGNDNNTGKNKDIPLKTLKKALELSIPGDTIYLRKGIYPLHNLRIKNGGSEGKPLTIQPYNHEKVIFEGDDLNSASDFKIETNWLIIKNIEVTKAFNGVRLTKGASHNQMINMISHHNTYAGFMLEDLAEDNTFLNCDAYGMKDYGNGDGFGTGDRTGANSLSESEGKNNKFINCRAWNNIDDGFDFYGSAYPITVIGCLSWHNGTDIDGNGFKLGPDNKEAPLQAKHHIENCMAWDNTINGFTYNGNKSEITFINNTSYNNHDSQITGANFRLWNTQIIKNNISILPVQENKLDNGENLNIDTIAYQNSWGKIDENSDAIRNEFISFDDSSITGLRNLEGTIPASHFLQLKPHSILTGMGYKN